MKTFEQLIKNDKVYYLDTESGIVVVHSVNSNEYNTLELDITDSGLLFKDFPIGNVKGYSKAKVYDSENDHYSGIYYSDKDECIADLKKLIEYQVAVNKNSINRVMTGQYIELDAELDIKNIGVIS